ncbi:hypothetical protein GCM10007390_34720 [Persicitalea jodogahamensis]|uniref:Uncharacterized protein n=1 Tax=Persicitalea jodogahamensis TaxID=402147 RepID=A0A8J3D5D9_9BACT|nr:hypothetical protein [Persicitalea jodogahamensis]GHB77604.1 hypothetical protein GCM10007390_34720 [Persicitalea jodogahamensis]
MLPLLGAAISIAGFISKDKVLADNDIGRYQGVAGERGFIILDTKTGQYILDSKVGYGAEMKWIRDFITSFRNGIDKTKK